MKKIFLIIVLAVLIACGQDISAQQVGIGGSNMIPTHGHNGPLDGGTLNTVTSLMSLTVNQTLTCGATTTINYGLVTGNTPSYYDIVTKKYTPTIAGYYYTSLIIHSNATTATGTSLEIDKNNILLHSIWVNSSTSFIDGVLSTLVYMNGTTDYLVTKINVTGASNCVTYASLNQGTTWNVFLVSR